MEPTITLKQAMTILDVSRTRMHQLITAGRIIGNKSGEGDKDPWLVTKASVEAYDERRKKIIEAMSL